MNDFNQKGTWSTLQFGGRAKRTPTDQLLSLKVTMRKAQANNEHVTYVFFNIGNAYDLKRRQDILKDLNDAGIT